MAMAQQAFPHPMSAHLPPGAHPMGPGHPSHHGMTGGQPSVMAQHMQAMGGPQVSQGQMMNMAQGNPGMGAPNAHAMSHLTPNLLQQQYQQQQMQQVMANNPQLLQNQQRQMQLHRQQQQMMQQGQANMGMNPNPQMMMNQMNRLPPHLQGMQPGHPGQFMPPNQQPQQQPSQEQLRQIAAIQAAQAASQAGGAPGQPPQQPMQPGRPPSTMGGADPQNAAAVQLQAQQAQQQAQHQAQQQAQQQQQQQQPQPPQNPGQQGPQPQVSQPPQNAQSQAQAPPQSQGTPQPSQGQQQAQVPPPQQAGQSVGQVQQQQQQQQQGQQQQQPNTQQPDATLQAKRQAQFNQMQQAQAMRNQAQAMAFTGMQNSGSRGMMSVFKLYQFGDQLGPAMVPPQNRSPASDILYWKNFVAKFFSETGLLRQKLWNCRGAGFKDFELATPVIARFYWTQYNSRVQKIQMIMDNPTEKEMPNGGFIVESSKTSFIYWYKDDHQVVANGSLRAQFNQAGKIDLLEHSVSEFKEYVPLKMMQMESPEQKPSPNVVKGNKKAAATAQRNSKASVIPKSVVGDWGLSDLVVQLLEIAETFSHMSALFDFARNNPDISAPEALRQLLQQWRSNPQNNAMADVAGGFNPMLPQQAGQGTPGPNLGGQQQFASPAPGAHLNLPNTASPASMNMSPAMQAHGLQQATANQGVSATTSPNMNNKRRRPSAVKQEDNDNGPAEVNGPKVKQSPRPPKRPKPPPQ